uniref:Uncharacterized protein n=1 Tax=Cucumis melo TaxID=3656 RepID=A0A9I9E800_CUCME
MQLPRPSLSLTTLMELGVVMEGLSLSFQRRWIKGRAL